MSDEEQLEFVEALWDARAEFTEAAERPTTYATIDRNVRRQAQPRRLAGTDLRTDR
ncbi:MAG: hypothetical protein ABSD02_06095 [Steroidobacteraceae bacterium]